MKPRTILITTLILFMTFELINSSNSIKKETKKLKKFRQGKDYKLTKSNKEIKRRDLDGEEEDGPDPMYEICKEYQKPSTAFTVVLMIYMVLIIVGAVLVMVLLKKDLEK